METDMIDDMVKCSEILEDINAEIISEIVYNNRRDCRNLKAMKNFSTLWECLSSASPRLAKNLGNPLLQDVEINDIPDLSARVLSAVRDTDGVFKQEDIEEKGTRKTVVGMQRAVSRLLVHLHSDQDY